MHYVNTPKKNEREKGELYLFPVFKLSGMQVRFNLDLLLEFCFLFTENFRCRLSDCIFLKQIFHSYKLTSCAQPGLFHFVLCSQEVIHIYIYTFLQIFTYERKWYSRKDLARHRIHGDPDDTSHRGHPLCKFCDERYLDNDELLKHLRRDHYFCHFCDSDGAQEYYRFVQAVYSSCGSLNLEEKLLGSALNFGESSAWRQRARMWAGWLQSLLFLKPIPKVMTFCLVHVLKFSSLILYIKSYILQHDSRCLQLSSVLTLMLQSSCAKQIEVNFLFWNTCLGYSWMWWLSASRFSLTSGIMH